MGPAAPAMHAQCAACGRPGGTCAHHRIGGPPEDAPRRPKCRKRSPRSAGANLSAEGWD